MRDSVKILIRTSIVLVFLLTMVNVFADKKHALEQQNQLHIFSNQMEEISPEWEVHVVYPVIKGLENKKMENTLNKKIKADLQKKIDKMKKDAEKVPGFPFLLYRTYHSEKNEHIYSIIIRSVISNGDGLSNQVISYNFVNDGSKSRMISLSDVANMDYIKSAIHLDIIQDPEKYGIGEDVWKRLQEDQPFYMKDGKLIIIFPTNQVAPNFYEPLEFSIDLKKL